MGHKLLSVCLIGRNDTYRESFKDHLALSINYLAYNAKKVGCLDQLEIVVTDWNSDTPLANEMKLTLEGQEICRFISVPPPVAKKYNHRETGFHSTISHNTSLRYAEAEFLLFMPGDILIPAFTLNQMMKLLTGKLDTSFSPEKAGMVISRKFIPRQFNIKKGNISFQSIDNYLLFSDFYIPLSAHNAGLFHGIGIMLMHRDIVYKVQGINEQMGGWGGSDVDMGLRINQHYPIVDLLSYGMIVYDFEPNDDFLKTKNDRINKLDYVELDLHNKNWGLADLNLKKTCWNKASYQETPSESEMQGHPDYSNLFSQSVFIHKTRRYIEEKVSDFSGARIKPHYFPLVWFALNHKCHKYLELGTTNLLASHLVSSVNPCAEIYFALPLAKTEVPAHDVAFVRDDGFSDFFEDRHKGYVRFITGNPKTSLDQLEKNFIGKLYFNLVLFEMDTFGEDFAVPLRKVTKYVPSGGCIVTIGSDLEQIYRMKTLMKEYFPGYSTIISDKHKVGLFLNEKIDMSSLDKDHLAKAWNPIRRKQSVYLLSLLLGKISRFLSKLIYVEFTRWPVYIHQAALKLSARM